MTYWDPNPNLPPSQKRVNWKDKFIFMRQAPNKRNKIAFKISGLIGQLRVPILSFKTRLQNKKNQFHINGFARFTLILALKQKLGILGNDLFFLVVSKNVLRQ